MLAPLGSVPEDIVEAASGLDERVRDAEAREQEFRGERNERRRFSGTDGLDRHHWNEKNLVEYVNRVELGVMVASLAVVQTRTR